MSFFQELKRRNVVRVGIAYVLISWVLLQGADFALDLIDAPNWVLQALFLLAALGLPGVLIFAWVFEMTPEGLKREKEIDRRHSVTPQTGRKLDRVIIVFLVLAVAVLLVERFVNPPESRPAAEVERPVRASPGESSGQAAAEIETASRQSVAVLPFIAMSNGPDDGYFADGLTEEILNALAQLPELLVTARTSAFAFKNQEVPVQEIAARLGVDHIVEGSVRRSGDRLRVTAQLIRASDGFHLWSNTYDSSSADTIAVQEDIAEKIAVALDVVLDEHRRELMQRNGLRDVEAFIAFQRGRELYEQAHTGSERTSVVLKQANRYFEEVLQRVPDFSPAWRLHSDLYIHQVLDDTKGSQTAGPADAEIIRTFELARADYEKAIQFARTPEERVSLELDLAYLTGNWRGMTDRIEKLLEQDGCVSSLWFEALLAPFGYAARLFPKAEELVACDPLAASSWQTLVRTRLWEGDPDGVIDITRRGLAVVDSDILVVELAKGMILKGQKAEAQAELDTHIKSVANVESQLVGIAATLGQREQAEALLAEYRGSKGENPWNTLAMYAWTGDREKANHLAAELDKRPFGHIALSVSVLVCECGAPWDLAATPVFAAKIAESGLHWPPPSPMTYPLKDW
jgi:TolB-like protein